MRKARNFTLIELLVVVAIIAILAGILMPALSSALQKAKNIACTGNQKMIGLSLSMYATDNREYFPPCNTWSTDLPWRLWHRTLMMGGYMGKAFNDINEANNNDKRGKNVFVCPEDTNPQAPTSDGEKDFLSYGLNAEITSKSTTTGYNYHYLPRNRLIIGSNCGRSDCNGTIQKGPQDIVILTDAYKSTQFVPKWCGYTIYAFPDTMYQAGWVAPRHKTGIPVTFVDGHVNFWKYPFIQSVLSIESSRKY